MSADPTSQQLFLLDLSYVDDRSTVASCPNLSRQIFEIRATLINLNSDLETLEGSKRILDYLNQNCFSGYHYIFLSDIFGEIVLMSDIGPSIESDVKKIHYQIVDFIEYVRNQYNNLDFEIKNRCVSFYGRCIDQEFGPEKRDSLLIYLKKISPKFSSPSSRTHETLV